MTGVNHHVYGPLVKAFTRPCAAVLQRQGEHAQAEARLAKVLIDDPDNVKVSGILSRPITKCRRVFRFHSSRHSQRCATDVTEVTDVTDVHARDFRTVRQPEKKGVVVGDA